MKTEYKPVVKTSIFSFTLLGIYILVIYISKDFVFNWNDPTSEIRNVVLVGAALIGIPFLILGHITRRQDFESKRQDMNYRSEASVNEFIMTQLSASAERFKEISEVGFSIPEREFQNSRTSNIKDLFHYILYDQKYRQYDILTAKAIDDLIFDLLFHFPQWNELNKHGQIIMTSLRTKRDFRNKNFGRMLSINLGSYIDSDSFKVLLFILCLKEFRRINLENLDSDLAIALNEIEVLIDLKIFPEPFFDIAQKMILNFIEAEGMLQGREN